MLPLAGWDAPNGPGDVYLDLPSAPVKKIEQGEGSGGMGAGPGGASRKKPGFSAVFLAFLCENVPDRLRSFFHVHHLPEAHLFHYGLGANGWEMVEGELPECLRLGVSGPPLVLALQIIGEEHLAAGGCGTLLY